MSILNGLRRSANDFFSGVGAFLKDPDAYIEDIQSRAKMVLEKMASSDNGSSPPAP